MSFDWIPGYSGDWESIAVGPEFEEKVWEPYRSWKARSGKTSIRSSSTAEYGAEFIEGLSDYYGVDLGEVGGADLAFAAMGDVEEENGPLAQVLLEETVDDERKLKYYLDKEFGGGGLLSGLRDYL